MTLLKQPPVKTFTYKEVCGLLCDSCKKGIPDVGTFELGGLVYHHVCNGVRISCTANAFRTSRDVHDLISQSS